MYTFYHLISFEATEISNVHPSTTDHYPFVCIKVDTCVVKLIIFFILYFMIRDYIPHITGKANETTGAKEPFTQANTRILSLESSKRNKLHTELHNKQQNSSSYTHTHSFTRTI